jgi:hypothetical protein
MNTLITLSALSLMVTGIVVPYLVPMFSAPRNGYRFSVYSVEMCTAVPDTASQKLCDRYFQGSVKHYRIFAKEPSVRRTRRKEYR